MYDDEDVVSAAASGTRIDQLPSASTATSARITLPQEGPPASLKTSLDKYGNDTALTNEFQQRLKSFQTFNSQFEPPPVTSSLPQPPSITVNQFYGNGMTSGMASKSSPFAQRDQFLKKSIWDGSPQSNPFMTKPSGYSPDIKPYNAMPSYDPSIKEYNWFNR